jgi:hypothetical protein
MEVRERSSKLQTSWDQHTQLPIHAVAGRTSPAGKRGSAAGSLLSSNCPSYTWACVLCRPSPELPFHFVWFLGWSAPGILRSIHLLSCTCNTSYVRSSRGAEERGAYIKRMVLATELGTWAAARTASAAAAAVRTASAACTNTHRSWLCV